MSFKNSSNLWLFIILFMVPQLSIAENAPDVPSDKTTNNPSGIYRNVNEDGVVEFSDQSISSSEKIKLKTTNTFKAAEKKVPPTKKATKYESEESLEQDAVNYTNLEISSPKDNAEIRSNDGKLSVSISVTPALNVAGGDTIELYFDGRSQGKQQGTQFSLSEVYRGEHRLQAKIINQSGTAVKISKPIQFNILKYSQLFKPNKKR